MGSAFLNPIADYGPPKYALPTQWDIVRIAGVASPGYCVVSEFKRKHEWDKKKGKGIYGSTITFVGRPAAQGSIKFFLSTGQDFIDWDAFRPLFLYDPTKQTIQAVSIYHPSLDDIKIKSVVTESIGNIIHEGSNLYSCTVDFIEFFPPPPQVAVGSPSQANAGNGVNGVNGPKPPSPTDPLQIKIAALYAQLQQP